MKQELQEQLAHERGYRQAVQDVFENHAAQCDEVDTGLLLELTFKSLARTHDLEAHGTADPLAATN